MKQKLREQAQVSQVKQLVLEQEFETGRRNGTSAMLGPRRSKGQRSLEM
jgi:hypothetical protein